MTEPHEAEHAAAMEAAAGVAESTAPLAEAPVTTAAVDAPVTTAVAQEPDALAAPSVPVTARNTVTVKLARFEGPLDLLLHLIKRDEIEITDIPISHITQQYLSYIELMRALDLDVAGEFLVMAATLMRIKAKMLLPLPAVGEDEARQKYPEGWKAPKPYLRIVPQPK